MTRTLLTLLLLPLASLPARADETVGSDIRVFPGGLANRRGERRDNAIKEGGGTKESEGAVSRGLRWLALHQAPDGRWSLNEFPKHARKDLDDKEHFDDSSTGAGMNNDTAGTAFGLLPFLGAGFTHKSVEQGQPHRYAKVVQNGISFLLQKQDKDGNLGGGMYAHALATIAICEAYGLTSDPLIKKPAQKALDYLIAAQDQASGGWRYQPKQSGDTSVTSWVVQALKSGQMAGLTVPNATLRGAETWLNSCEKDGLYGYVNAATPTPSMTAAATLSRQFLGVPRRNPRMKAGVEFLLKNAPPGQSRNVYYEYYATQVMHHMGGNSWDHWNAGTQERKGMRQIYLDRQGKDGSWDPAGDAFGSHGGRIMQTSLSLLSLEIYYRHVPLYQRNTPEK